MADNVSITAGSGTVISTEEVTTLNGGAVSAQQVQRAGIALITADGAAVDVPGSTADGVLVNLGTNNDVTANAGTNLNTSALALESGGNLAGAATSLAVLDDWDETDRAKVNIIVGQAGIAAGTGVDGATVPRVTLATNVGLPAGTSNIGKVVVDSTTMQTGAGSLTAQDQAVTLTLLGESNVTFQLTGTWSATMTFEASNDNSNWQAIFAMKAGDNVIAQTATANDIYRCTSAGFKYVRARCSAFTSGTIVVTAYTSQNTSGVFLNFPLPPGTNSIGLLGSNSGVDIGDVTINNASGASAVNIQDGGNQISVDWNGTAPVTGSGNATGALRVELANNGTGLVGLNTGTNSVGDVGIKPRTTGGLTTFHLVSAATTNATNVKASAGQLFGWYIQNNNAAMRKVAFHNTAGTPTAGASIFFTLSIPGGGAANVMSETGVAFGTGIAITTVTGQADSDATAVAANDLNINLFYA